MMGRFLCLPCLIVCFYAFSLVGCVEISGHPIPEEKDKGSIIQQNPTSRPTKPKPTKDAGPSKTELPDQSPNSHIIDCYFGRWEADPSTPPDKAIPKPDAGQIKPDHSRNTKDASKPDTQGTSVDRGPGQPDPKILSCPSSQECTTDQDCTDKSKPHCTKGSHNRRCRSCPSRAILSGGPTSCKDTATWIRYLKYDCQRAGMVLDAITFCEPCSPKHFRNATGYCKPASCR